MAHSAMELAAESLVDRLKECLNTDLSAEICRPGGVACQRGQSGQASLGESQGPGHTEFASRSRD